MLEPESAESAERLAGALRQALEPEAAAVVRLVSRALAPRRSRNTLTLRRWGTVGAAALALGVGLFLAGLPSAPPTAGTVPLIANQGSVIVIRRASGSGIILSSSDADRSNPAPRSLILIAHGGAR